MKNNIYHLFILFFFTFLISSCKKDFLEIEPKGKLVAKNVDDYNLLLNNLSLLNTNADAQVPMGDEVIALDPYFSGSELRTQKLFRWEADVYLHNESSREISSFMPQIYTYNKIINEVMDAEGGTEPLKKSILAEAMVGRAWCYFMLINYFGKPYNEATAASDPGYPIVTEADVTQTSFKRATVKEVYDFIVQDLTTAIPSLPVNVSARLRASKPAATALLGKVYVFMGKFSEALTQLNSTLTGIASSTIPVRLYDYNVTMAPGGIMGPGFFGPNYPTAPNNEESLLAKQFINNWSFTNDEILLSPEAAAKYAANDWRLNFYSTDTYGGDPVPVAGALRRVGPIAVQFFMVLPDVYLLRAEVKARLDDLGGAKTDLETLRSNRLPPGSASVPAGLTRKQMLDYIMDERIREFGVHGYRWFDMRRLSVDPLFAGISFSHKYYPTPTTSQTITLNPARFTMRFPQRTMNQNPDMENNP